MITGMGAGAGWWGGGKTAGDVANIGTTATTTLQPGMTIDSILKPAAPLTLQNFNQGGNVMQLGSRLSGGTYDPSTGTTYFKLR
jgi:hypothetical protein